MGAKKRDERGAYAVLFGLLVVVLVSVAALAVDLGNAVARKADVTSQADFAALAAGREMDVMSSIPQAAVDAARDYLNDNHPLDQSCGSECVTSAQLEDGDLTNGEIRLANGGLQVVTPHENVDYGLAGVMGFDDIDVQADATVRIASYKGPSLPAYAVNPCDYGRQVLTDPASGHSIPVNPPPLFLDGQSNSTELDSISPTEVAYDADSAVPQPTISVTGQKFKRTTHVGFFNASLEVRTFALPAPPAPFTDNGNATISNVTVPQEVTSSEEVWYVRVLNDEANTPADTSDDRWSSSDEAIPLRVGNAVLECDSDVFGGNFGTIRMDRDDANSDGEELARNFALGYQNPIYVLPHVPVNGSTPVPGGVCFHGDLYGSVESSETNNPIHIGFNENTDCIRTDPGLPANAAADGLVKGGSGFSGRLTNKATRSGCAPGGGSGLMRVNVQGPYDINNEVLSCYLTSTSTPLSAIATAGYSGGPALDPDIWESPRFSFVPVLGVQPATGTHKYSVVELRPAFITDESLSSTKGNSDATGTTSPCSGLCNGLRIENNDITQLTVIFFNINALPPNPNGDLIDYLGDGPKAVQLID